MSENDFAILQFPPGVSCPPNVLMHKDAQDELQDIVKQNPQARMQLKSRLNAQLSYLSQNLGQETKHQEWFEHLKNEAPYKSMRFAHVKILSNLRIIYGVANEKAYLFVAFTEQNTSDYKRALGVAKHRAKGIF